MANAEKQEFVYRISTQQEWNELQRTGSTMGGDFDKQTRFIHLCSHSQISFVLTNHFAGLTNLFILKLDPSKLGDGLVYECSDGVNTFPHFYGSDRSHAPLSRDYVLEARPLEFDNHGNPVLPF